MDLYDHLLVPGKQFTARLPSMMCVVVWFSRLFPQPAPAWALTARHVGCCLFRALRVGTLQAGLCVCRRRLESGTEPKLEADGDGRPIPGTRPKTRRRMKQAKMLTESVLLNHFAAP